jgi:DNA polymerase III alpha subunit
LEFSAALIRSVEDDIDTQSFYISEIQNTWIKVLNPDVNESYTHVAAIWDDIRLWFFSVKWIWEDVWEVIQNEREKWWKFKDLEDFLRRCSEVVNKKSLEWLIKSWALDNFNDRKVLLENVDVLIDWTKNISHADFWLFGWMWIDTKIALKKVEPSNHMQKLMMEQEVLKVFVSWNPLDGLYQYIKKFSFLNQIQEQENINKFVIIWYIKEVQRAKKKWFFIKIEDISWNWEFFVREAPDINKFDLIMLHWSKKWWRVFLDKMVRTDYETLKRLAWDRFDPEWTVVRAKKERYWDQKQNEIQKIKTEEVKKENTNKQEEKEYEQISEKNSEQELVADENFPEEWSFDEESVENEFDTWGEDIQQENEEETEETPVEEEKDEVFSIKELPDSFDKINQIANILKNYPWDISVFITDKEKKVNAEGLELLKKL